MTPDARLVEAFVVAGGLGKPRVAQIHVCWAETDTAARRTAHEWWPVAALPGSLLSDLALPRDFERAAALVREEDLARLVVSGPDPERHHAGIARFAAAGFNQLFWLVQVLAGGPTITAFMGEQIAEAGGYPSRLAPAIGWAVHLGVSLSYAFLFAVILVGLAGTRIPAQVGISLAVAATLGWATAVVAPPAISVTISLFGGQGWPSEIFPPNTEVGLPFWNHVGFFLLNWLVQALGPRLLPLQAARSATVGEDMKLKAR